MINTQHYWLPKALSVGKIKLLFRHIHVLSLWHLPFYNGHLGMLYLSFFQLHMSLLLLWYSFYDVNIMLSMYIGAVCINKVGKN